MKIAVKNRKLGFSKQQRLAKNEQFRDIIINGERFRTVFLKVSYQSNNQRHPRLGVSISKKVVKNAVERNRVRRIVRESFRAHQGKVANVDLVISLHRKPCLDKPEQIFLLKTQLESLWKRISVESIQTS